jgi:hypothetical protein
VSSHFAAHQVRAAILSFCLSTVFLAAVAAIEQAPAGRLGQQLCTPAQCSSDMQTYARPTLR